MRSFNLPILCEKMKNYDLIKRLYYEDRVLGKIMFNQLYFINKGNYREFSLLNYIKKEINGKEILTTAKDQNLRKIAYRGLTFKNFWYFKKTLEYLEFYKNDSNMYVSCARLLQLPSFPFDHTERKKQTKPFYEKDYIKYITNYDIFIDFDVKTEKQIPILLKDLDKVIKLLYDFKIRCEIVFSGSRGFKVLIYNDSSYNIEEVSNIIYNLKDSFDLKIEPDFSGLGIPSKLMKANFSLVIKEDSIKACFPLKFYNYQDIFDQIRKDKDFSVFSLDSSFKPSNSPFFETFPLGKYITDPEYKHEFFEQLDFSGLSQETRLKEMVNRLKLLRPVKD